MRQGCPLSPLLYLEPLLARLRGETSFAGLYVPRCGGLHVKVSAYANDVTLFLSSDRDFRAVGHMLEAFTKAIGARGNWRKSCAWACGLVGGQSQEIICCADTISMCWVCISGKRTVHKKLGGCVGAAPHQGSTVGCEGPTSNGKGIGGQL